MSYGYNQAYGVPIPAPAPAPPPIAGDYVYEIPVSPGPSPPASRGQSRVRRTTESYVTYGDSRDKQYYGGGSGHLSVAGGNIGRSNSVGAGGYRRDRGQMEVSRSGDRPRSTYYGHSRHASNADDEYYLRGRQGGKVYYGGGGYPESAYSSSSRGSRDQSRGPSHSRRHRSPSCHSCDGYDHPPHSPHVAPYPSSHWPVATIPTGHQPHPSHPMMGAPAPPPMPGHPNHGPLALFNPAVLQQEDPATYGLNKQIKELQEELEKSKIESEKIRLAKEREEAEAKHREELQMAVKLEIARKQAEAEAAARAAAAEEAKISAAARALYEEQKKKEEEEAKKKAAEEAAQKQAADLAAAAEKLKLDLTKPTYTKFSKTHLCKEALDERKIMYTEQEDSFLVHRWVDREEQQALWARTKEIRAYQLEYQRKFKEAADLAPIVKGPNGPIKIVRVGNNPPVTVPVVMVTKKTNKGRAIM